MKNTYIILTLFFVAIFIYYINNRVENCQNDQGYVFNKNVGACIHENEMTEDIMKAAKIAVDYVGRSNGLKVVAFNSYEEVGAYDIFFEKGDEKTKQTIYIKNWKPTMTQETQSKKDIVKINPVSHATMVINWGDKVVYVDPIGGVKAFANYPKPDIILVTDIHQDHFDPETIASVSKESTRTIVPQAVFDLLKSKSNKVIGLIILNNKEKVIPPNFYISIEAVPMYNLPEKTDAFHTRGRGNGYVLEKDGFKVYIAGDTSGIPEMRALKNIDIAFVPMNLPYTMTVEEAVDAVLAFKPKQVWPYHYRNKEGMSDVVHFKDLINKSNPNIEVVLGKWY